MQMKPNVLYLFADQLSAFALNRPGHSPPVRTPYLDALAEQGVRFERSYCVTPQCSPSRSSILTGLYPHRTGVIGNQGMPGTEDLSPNIPNLGSLLKQSGYNTAYFGKWHLGGAQVGEYGFNESSTAGNDSETVEQTLLFLEQQAVSVTKPWLCMVSFNNPHDIYHVNDDLKHGKDLGTEGIVLPQSFADDLLDKPEAQRLFRDEDQGRPLVAYGEKEWKYYLAYYYRLVEKVDSMVGQIIERLKSTGQFNNTLIVFTSDHGDLMSSHRSPFKGPMMYEELARIPLLFSWPGVIPKGEIRRQININLDHLPTILDLLELPVPDGLDGSSLKASLLDGSAASRNSVVLQYYSKQKWVNPIRTLIEGNVKYNLYRSGEEELYNLDQDAGEVRNLAKQTEAATLKKHMKSSLLRWIEAQKDPFFTYTRTDRDGNPLSVPIPDIAAET